MSDIGDGLGTASEGGLLARTVDRADSEAGPRSDAETICLNCGAALVGSHCHSCGQKAHIHRSLKTILHDLVHGVLHLDGKLWRTLPLLAWKPGNLTRRYIDGERAKFVSPMAMFLFGVFLMFAVFQVLGIAPPSDIAPSPDMINKSVEATEADVREEIADARAALGELPADNPERAELRAALNTLEGDLAALESAGDVLQGTTPRQTSFNATGFDEFDQKIVQKWRDNPGLMLYKLQNNSYKFSWLLIPLSIPAVWLLFFWKRRFKAYDHAIFVTYSLAFMSLLFLALSVLGKIGIHAFPLVLIGVLVPPVHIFRHLRGTYELSFGRALWRTWALLNLILGVIIGFLWLLLLLGAL